MVYREMVGARVKRKEDPRLITGKASFVPNLTMPNMGYVAFVRSPYAHARILSIDGGEALKRDGVIAVITGQELSSRSGQMSMMPTGENAAQHSHYPLSVERVRFAGEAVAAVIATSAIAAEDAVGEVLVDWEMLPSVADPEKALEPGAPRVYDDLPDNVEHRWSHKMGDVATAFAQAHRVVKQRLVSQRLAGVPM